MKRQRGFTLVEVLIAFAILSLVLTALYEASGTGLRSFAAAAQVQRALLLAQSRLDRIVAQRRLPSQPDSAVAGTPFTWHVETLQAPKVVSDLKPLSARIILVRLRVTWPGNRGTQGIAVERLVTIATEAQ